MKYYSEILEKLFNSEDELLSAEAGKKAEDEARHQAEIKEAMEKKKARAELDKARTAASEAGRHYGELLGEYCRKYGAYKYTSEPNDFYSFSNGILGSLAHNLGIF